MDTEAVAVLVAVRCLPPMALAVAHDLRERPGRRAKLNLKVDFIFGQA
jgi:hypothetical protein